jgi:peptidoglycan/xylan/chitin deacetylase (PgdA/CDA1 family)
MTKGMQRVGMVLARCGAPALLGAVRKARRAPGRGIVLMYHRVAAEADPMGMSVTPEHFDRQLASLARRARIVPLGELVRRMAAGVALAGDFAAITFDDGYRDNYTTALPILKRHQATATVFVTTDFVDGRRRPLSGRLIEALRRLWRRGALPASWPDSGDAEADAALRVLLARPHDLKGLAPLKRAYRKLPWERAEDLAGRLEDLAGGPAAPADEFLDWDQVRALSREGIEIGSHTVGHPILSCVSRERGEREIAASRRRLEAEIGAPVRGFAFPNGHRGDFTEDNVRAVPAAGYEYACTAEPGVNLAGGDPLLLRRIGVGDVGPRYLEMKLELGR